MANIQNQGSIFTSVEKKRQKRSTFNLSHDVKLSLDMGKLVPTYLQEIIPGDKMTISTSSMLRMAPLISPVMHKINVYQEFFFVPNRILWPNWETFITGARNGKQLPADETPAFPFLLPFWKYIFEEEEYYHFENGTGSLMDYFGIPTADQFPDMYDGTRVNALPFAAYQRIFDEYYRDENLMTSIYDIEYEPGPGWEQYNGLKDGVQSAELQEAIGGLRTRAWEHDYFTSALPWAQKGEEVTVPVDLKLDLSVPTYVHPATLTGKTDDDLPIGDIDLKLADWANPPASNRVLQTPIDGDDKALVLGTSGQYKNVTTINDLRAAIKLQEWLETNARGGSRYFESIYAHFGVQSPDARLQRPEFIGSSRSNMIISEVLQTSSPQGENDTPQGNLSGHGQSVGSTKDFHYTAQEHGFIIGLISILPNTAYQQGIPKHFLKHRDRLQYYFPEFAHLGEQEIENQEIYAQIDPEAQDPYLSEGTFGYVPRYSEYKFTNSRVAGDFRDTLDFWHLGRIFDNSPRLNDFFIAANPSKRVFAVEDLPRTDDPNGSIRDYHSIYAHVFHDVKASRLMPKYGTPSFQ